MPTITVRIRRARKRSVKQLIRNIPGYASGRIRDAYSIGKAFRMNFCVAFLEKVAESFEAKSRGGADDLGNKWKPLKRETIAQRPLQPGERKRLGIKPGERYRGLLTAGQDAKWRGIFRTNFLRLVSRVGELRAKQLAAQMAWAILKAEGAKTKLEVLGGRNVLINRVSDALYRSFTPGRLHGRVVMSYTPPQDQVFEIERRGEMRVGSRIKYAGRVNKLRAIIPKRHGKWDKFASERGVEAVATRIEQVMR